MIFLLVLISNISSASPPPCTKWEFLVRAHKVSAHERKGSEVSASKKTDFCKAKYPKVVDWQQSFRDSKPNGWPNVNEIFKYWSQSEKEIVSKYLSEQPKALRELQNISLHRGTNSKVPGNPGASQKNLNVITLYDSFFNSKEKSRILTHELSHQYLYSLDKIKLGNLIHEMGWRQRKENQEIIKESKARNLKPDSELNLGEDLANHFEVYVHEPEKLKTFNPKAFEALRILVGPEFKLEQ